MNKKLLSGVIAAVCTVVAFGATACEKLHEHDFAEEWKSSDSGHWHECLTEDCGGKSEVLSHDYGEWTVVTAATEEAGGLDKRTCSVCNYSQMRQTAKLNHQHTFSQTWFYDSEEHWHECTADGCNEKDSTAAHTWDNGTVTTQPTETTAGVRTYKCTQDGCNASKTEPIAELGHTHTPASEWSYNATHHYKECTGTSCVEQLQKAEHTLTETVTKTATCTEAGSKTLSCTCGYSKTESISALTHSWGEWEVTQANKPTAEAAGKATRTCTRTGCGTVDAREITIPALTSNDYTKTNNTATCTEGGTATYSYTEDETIVTFTAATAANGHKYKAQFDMSNVFSVTATLTCENCSDVSESLIHSDMTMAHEQVESSCSVAGYSTWTASFTYDGQTFSDEKTNTLELREHMFRIWANDAANHWKVCAYVGCDEIEEASVKAHDYENDIKGYEILTRATATEQGEKEIECECGYKHTVKFDGAAATCELTSLYTVETNFDGSEKSRTNLTFTEGKYFHLNDRVAVHIGLDKTVAAVELYYKLTEGADYNEIPYVSIDDPEEPSPVFYAFTEAGDIILRFYEFGGTYPQLNIKALIYVTDESVPVEKTFTVAPVPTLVAPQAQAYNEGKLTYEWASISNASLYLGQEYKLKALGYSVKVDDQPLTLNAQGEATFTPAAAGVYTLTVTSPYNAEDSYTAKITVAEAYDTSNLFAGNWAGGDYTVAFGAGSAVTVKKDGEADAELSYTYAEGVFKTTGSESLSIVLTPAYKLFLVAGDDKFELVKTGEVSNQIYSILGGTSWNNFATYSYGDYVLTIVITFDNDGTGSITKYLYDDWLEETTTTTYNFTYGAEEIDGYYKLTFNFVSAVTGNNVAFYEVGTYVAPATSYFTSNDFSITNKDSKVTVEDEVVSLSLWLLTGDSEFYNSTEQAVDFDKVVAD